MSTIYVQYGCGLSAPAGWNNYDASPTLRLQKLPVVGGVFKKKVDFPSNVRFGNILKTLPGIKENSCDGIYCSHVLEHLSLNDFHQALKNTYGLLKSGGIFRCVLPDLEFSILQYIEDVKSKPELASINFLNGTMLGIKDRPKGFKQFVISLMGNSHHLWMWDQYALKNALEEAGFIKVRKCIYNDCEDKMFKLVEDESRFINAISFEAVKP
ncbi:MAG: methyltransferase domain-containing protein [Sphingobacteriales bacterium]|nr:methyltransferase domain-containing protein [Sphingobacteriales bacterium]